MRVTLVTTWGIACGIAEHSFYLKQAIEQADPSIEIEVESNLHPSAVDHVLHPRALPAWVWLNYHAALHSQWTPAHVQRAQAWGVQVGITYHDSGVPNSAQCKALHAVADAFVIHEPADDLPGAIYLRQGIPAYTGWQSFWIEQLRHASKGRPIVGSVGFPFPWKNLDLLAEASERAGWALALVAPGATAEQMTRWAALNPASVILPEFLNRTEVQGLLEGCDATAFLYANANTGTSAAIRLGVAARKPVLASDKFACRQFRDLYDDPLGYRAIRWLDKLSVDDVAWELSDLQLGPIDTGSVRLAHQDRWEVSGQRYAEILRGGQP